MKRLLLILTIALTLIAVPISITSQAAGCVTGESGTDVEGYCVVHHMYCYCSGGVYTTWDDWECY